MAPGKSPTADCRKFQRNRTDIIVSPWMATAVHEKSPPPVVLEKYSPVNQFFAKIGENGPSLGSFCTFEHMKRVGGPSQIARFEENRPQNSP